MQTEIPEFLIEMSERMNTDPNRCTAHPFWQVRCKRKISTQEGINESGYVVVSEDGEVYCSNDPIQDLHDWLLENHESWVHKWNEENHEEDDIDVALSYFCPEDNEWPEGVSLVYLQEIEEVVSTHMTQHGAEAFIKRKQHDYPPLYTYVESAYWSPEFRQLQDWIKSLTQENE